MLALSVRVTAPEHVQRLTLLLAKRQKAWESLSDKPFADQTSEELVANDRASRAFREADKGIVEELRKHAAPVVVGDHCLHLTADRLNFIISDASTATIEYGRSYIRASRIAFRYEGRS